MIHKEYEVRIYDIDERSIKKRLRKLGAKLVNKRQVMPVIVYHHPQGKEDSYIRIRHEGKQITMTIKTELQSRDPIEREVEINNMEEGIAILKFLGCTKNYMIEKIRETWWLPDSKEIVFDSYPGLPTYLEIDCPTKAKLKKVTQELGFTLKDHSFDKIADRYLNLYGITNNRPQGDLTFSNGSRVLGPFITKNKKEFQAIIKEQKIVK